MNFLGYFVLMEEGPPFAFPRFPGFPWSSIKIPSPPHRRCWPSWPDLRGRWPSRLVATAANRL